MFPAECCRRPEASPVKTSSSAAQLAPLCFYFWLLQTKENSLRCSGCLERRLLEQTVKTNSPEGEDYIYIFLLFVWQRDKLSSPQRKASGPFHWKHSILQNQRRAGRPECVLRSIRHYFLSTTRVRSDSYWMQEERRVAEHWSS